MIDYRSRSVVPNYLSRPYQRRVMYLVAGLFIVVFLMAEIGKPDSFRWIWYLTQPAKKEVDTSARRPPKQPTVPGQFKSLPDQKPVEQDFSKPFYLRVRPELMDHFKDNEGFSPLQTTALLHLADILKVTDQATIKAAPAEKVSHIQLWEQSKEYRGRLVTVNGRVHGVQLITLRLRKRDAAVIKANEKETTDQHVLPYYQISLQPNGSTNVIVIYCLELPAGFPIAMKDIDETVEITGFYLKKWWYESTSIPKKESTKNFQIAPLMIAKNLDWTPKRGMNAANKREFNLPLLLGLLATAAAVALLVVMFARRSGRNKLPDYVKRLAKASNRDHEFFPNVDEVLRTLDQSGQNSTGDDADAP